MFALALALLRLKYYSGSSCCCWFCLPEVFVASNDLFYIASMLKRADRISNLFLK